MNQPKRLIRKKSVVIGLLICLSSSVSFLCKAKLSGNYTINPAQNSSVSNYISIDDAISDLTNGSRTYGGVTANGPGVSGPVIFKISDGTYYVQETIGLINGVSLKNTITFISASADSNKVILQNSNENPIIVLDGAQYVNFKNITFSFPYYSYNSSYMFMKNGSGYNTVSGCRFLWDKGQYAYTTSMIDLSGAGTGNIFSNNYFKNCKNGIYSDFINSSSGIASTLITNNIFDSVSGTAISLNNASNVTISGNRVLGFQAGTNGIILQNCTGNISITKNIVNADNGIEVFSNSPVRLSKGDISNNMVIAISLGLDVYNCKNLNIYYNTLTIYNSTFFGYMSCCLIAAGDTVSIKNNNIANFGKGQAISINSGNTGLHSDHNNLFCPDSAIGLWNGKKEKALKDLTKVSGLDSNSISVQPYFRSLTDDHALSPLLMAGISLSGISTDIDNNTRSTTVPIIGANEFTVYTRDAGIYAMDSIKPSYCKGSSAPVYVRLINLSTSYLTATTIGWNINGKNQTAYNWTGSIAPGQSSEIKIGTVGLLKTCTIKSWTGQFNSLTDQNHKDDTISIYVQVKMTGKYTLGGTSADFASFNDAAAELERSGLCSSVEIDVNNGIYKEQVMFPFIQGSAKVNTITFKGISGDSTKTVLEYPSSTDNSKPNYVLEVAQGKYYVFQHLGFVRTGTDSNATVLAVTSGSDSNTFIGNRFISNQTNSLKRKDFYLNDAIDLQASSGNILKYNLIRNGTVGVFMGSLSGSYATAYRRNQILDNIIDSFGYYGFYGDGINLKVNGNQVKNSVLPYFATGIYVDGDTLYVEKNKIFLPFAGTGISTNFSSGSNTSDSIENNFITIKTSLTPDPYNVIASYGIYVLTDNPQSLLPVSSALNIFHNSVNMTGNDSRSVGVCMDGQTQPYSIINSSRVFFNNNIIINNAGGYAITNSQNADVRSDYNNLNSTGNIGGVKNTYYGTTKDCQTLADWIKNANLDSNSIVLPSWFKSETDLHAQNPSLAGKGKPLSTIKTDIDGKPRNTIPTIGANELNPIPNDAGVSALINPSLNFCAGSNDYIVSLRNYGSNNISSDSIIWQLNGKKQKSYYFSGNIAPGDSSIVDIGAGILNTSTSNDWFVSSYPNAKKDLNSTNDTARFHFNSSMHGVYTIGGNNPDFNKVSDAVNALTVNHICASVVFNIRSGIYNEAVSIPYIQGVSSTNTITFEAESGDSNSVILTSPSSNPGIDSNYAIQLDSAFYIIFNHLTISRTGSDFRCGDVEFIHNPAYNTFENCRITGNKNRFIVSDSSSLILVDRGYDFNNHFKNNVLKYGTYSFYPAPFNTNHNPLNRGIDTFLHNTIDSCISGVFGQPGIQFSNIYTPYNTYFAYNRITNFANAAVWGCNVYANRMYSPINSTYAVVSCDSVVNNIISTSAPVAVSESDYIFYNNIAIVGYHQACDNFIGIDEESVAGPHIKNNNITFLKDPYVYPGLDGLCYVYKTQNYSPYPTRYDSTLVNHNNFYTFFDLMAVEYEKWWLASYGSTYTDLGVEFDDRETASGWGAQYDIDAGNYGQTFPDKNSVIYDPMYYSNATPEATNYKLAHAGTPVPGIAYDINGKPRDKNAPSIGAEEISEQANNISVVKILPQQICGDTSYAISVIVQNRGTASQTDIPVSAEIRFGNTFQKITDTIKDTLNRISAYDTFVFKKPVSLYQSGIYNIKAYVTLSGDQNNLDDTASYQFQIVGNKLPDEKMITICNAARTRLTLNNISAEDSISWYKTITGGTSLSNADTFITGTITGDSTFYVSDKSPQRFHLNLNDSGNYTKSFSTSNAIIYLTMYKNCRLDSATIYPEHSGSIRFSTHYYSAGNYIATTPHFVNVNVTRPYEPVKIAINIPLNLPANNTRGGVSLVMDSITTGSLMYHNELREQIYNQTLQGILSITGDSIQQAWDGCNGITQPYLFNWVISTTCPLERFPYKVLVGGKPTFSLDKDPASEATYKSGTLSDPDLLCMNSTSIYRIFSAYPDADYGTTWKLKSVSFQSLGGSNSKDTQLIIPSSKSIGKFIFTPQTVNDGDSIYKLNMTMGAVSGSGCDTTVTRYIRVVPLPVAKFYAANKCLGQTVYFSDSTSDNGPLTYSWDFGDSTSSVLKNPTHIYSKPGIYSIVLTATNFNGCKDSISHKISIYSIPRAIYHTDTIACIGKTVVFVDSVTLVNGDSATWYFGDGKQGSGQHTSHIYTDPGHYTTLLVIKNLNGCKDSASQSIDISPIPHAIFSSDTIVCSGGYVSFTDKSTHQSGDSAYWNFGDGYKGAGQSTSHAYASSGHYIASLVIKNIAGCQDSVSKEINVLPLPQPVFSSDTGACFGSNINFVDNSIRKPGDSAYWSFGDGITDTGQNISHTYNKSGQYKAILFIRNASGCQDSISKSISIYQVPDAGFKATNVCAGDSVHFVDTTNVSASFSSTWFFDDSTTSTTTNPAHLFKISGTHSFRLIVKSAYGCKDSTTGTVQVYPLPSPVFTFVQTQGLNINYHASDSLYASYQWQFGDTTTNTSGFRVSHIYKALGTYQASLQVKDTKGCSASSSRTVIVKKSWIDESGEDYLLNVYPNPFSTSVQIKYTTSTPTNMTWQIFDMEGKMLAYSEDIKISSGVYIQTLNTSLFAEGVYNLRITINGTTINKKLIRINQR